MRTFLTLFVTSLLAVTLQILVPSSCDAADRPPAAAISASGETDESGAGAEITAPTDTHPIWQQVSGTGVHYFTSAIVHSQEPTPTGMVQRSTDTIALDGDLTGRILYHPVSVFDFVEGTLTNSGDQVFSGTVFGSEPVMLHDDRFLFLVDLNTGATVGQVYLDSRLDGPNSIACRLEVVGTGLTPEGDATVAYSGKCRITPSTAN